MTHRKLPEIHGKAEIVRSFYDGAETLPLWSSLYARVNTNPSDAAAFLDLSVMLQAMGKPEEALQCQRAAIDICRSFRVRTARDGRLTVLAFVAPGNFMANTPIEFLLERANVTLLLHYVDQGTTSLADVPAHDVGIVAISQSRENEPVLANLGKLLANWRKPLLNADTAKIAAMTRDTISSLFAGESSLLSPRTVRMPRNDVLKIAAGAVSLQTALPGCSFPVIIRPFDSHAGVGLRKMMNQIELLAYLMEFPDAEFYLAPFVDYSSADGKFRKARIAVIDGKPYASHLAVSQNWMVHYLNAEMTLHADRRQEEAEWMDRFHSDFAVRHAEAFRVMHEKLELDYFVIDCGELPDGRLVLFEADTGMIVHSMDPVDMFPYKARTMSAIFAAFEISLIQHAHRAAAPLPLAV
ncbi:MAG: tetratricopeptide repeat-containing protein [Rhizobiales bacterium]|nr:tetratricopeptide repeat-containing protein [Hyphomicrobiales bacterium]